MDAKASARRAQPLQRMHVNNALQTPHLIDRRLTAHAGSSNSSSVKAACHSAPSLSAADCHTAMPTRLTSRRTAMIIAYGLALVPSITKAAHAGTDVGSYLPAAGVEDFVTFVPDPAKTPALRAGTVDRQHPYRFDMPPTWHEARVANTQSGNYCQPRCAEPWTEVVFENDKEGRIEVIVSPLVRFTNKPGTRIEDINSPKGLLQSLGPFITGTYLDEEDVVAADSKALSDGLTYYYYEVNAPYGRVGPRSLAAATTKGDLALLFVVSATEKQWAKNEMRLRLVRDSFRA